MIEINPNFRQLIIESLAKLSHIQWCEWMLYLFQKSEGNPDGSVTIPQWAVERWMRQIETAYSELPEKEKESDREEARKVLKLIEYSSLFN